MAFRPTRITDYLIHRQFQIQLFLQCQVSAVAKAVNATAAPISLARHDGAHLGFGVADQLAADIKCDVVELSGICEGGFVLVRDRGSRVSAYSRATSQAKHDGISHIKFNLSDQLAIDIELSMPRGPFALENFRFACDFKLEA